MDISIIILNYKSQHYLFRCIESLRKHLAPVSYEIIVLNNDSTPISTIIPSSNLIIINNVFNGGFAKTCNDGAAKASGNILFFLNPDTEIITGKFTQLLAAMQEPGVGIISPRLLTTAGLIQPWSAGYEITLHGILLNNFGFIRSKNLWMKENVAQPDWTSGAALAIRRDIFKKLHGFDESFFMYFEDVDLCKKVRRAGYKITILPTIQILHFGGGSCSSSIQQKKYYYASQDYYFKKYHSPFSLFLLKFLRGTALIFRK